MLKTSELWRLLIIKGRLFTISGRIKEKRTFFSNKQTTDVL